jgi:hypothetical protein
VRIIGEPPAGDRLSDATGTTFSLQCGRRTRTSTGATPWSARDPRSRRSFMTNTALTGATFDIDGGQQLITGA